MSTAMTLFATAALMTVASPGPTSLLALNNGARWGLVAALPGIAGATLSDLLLIAAVAMGLGAVVAATPWTLELMRWVGVAYLAYLGWQLLRRPGGDNTGAARPGRASGRAPQAPPGRIMARSFMVAITNPKAYLFFMALLPSFIDPQAPALAQYLRLALTFACIDGAVLIIYACAGAFGMARLSKNRSTRGLDRFSGVALLGMALVLAMWRREVA